jgi:hypothetical protein
VKVKSGTGEAEKAPARVFHADLWGRREIYEGDQLSGGKYNWLWQNSAETTSWVEVPASDPGYLFAAHEQPGPVFPTGRLGRRAGRPSSHEVPDAQ